MREKIKKLLIDQEMTIKSAMKSMDIAGHKILFVVDGAGNLLGSLSDGDIRRWILKEGSLQEPVSRVYNKSPKFARAGYDPETVKVTMVTQKIEALPVKEGDRLVDVVFWDELFLGQAHQERTQIGVPVLIMSGGKGTRLDPFTRVLPKPLIPLGEKTIVETIMDRFSEYGCMNFYLTVNYKGKMIQAYFDSGEASRYGIHFLHEDLPRGTAGSISLIEKSLGAPHFFVTNCDILIDGDYADLYQFHCSQDNDITVVGSVQHIAVPYGVLETKSGGSVAAVVEKPEYDLLVNTGMYVLKRDVIRHIPKEGHYDFTTLITDVKKAGGKVGVYPVTQKSWIDVGQWHEYQNALKRMEGVG